MLNWKAGLNYTIARNLYILVTYRLCSVNNGINSSSVLLSSEFHKVTIKLERIEENSVFTCPLPQVEIFFKNHNCIEICLKFAINHRGGKYECAWHLCNNIKERKA